MLAKANRVRLKRDFERVFASPRSLQCRFFRLKAVLTESEVTRFGIVTSAKVSKKAVARNRLRRRLRSILATELPALPVGYDIVIFCQPAAATAGFAELRAEVAGAFGRLFSRTR